MLPITRVAVLAMVIAILGPIGLNLFGPGSRFFTPGPIDTSEWTTYTSDRYGFSIGYPADWTERPAIGTWSLATDADWQSPASEGFRAPGSTVLVTAWSVPVAPGTTAEAWIGTYCHLNTTPCTGLEDRTIPVTIDGHPGSLVRFQGDTQAFMLVGDRIYVVAVWEPDSDPRTAPYGGATRLLEGYLSTMRLLPGGPGIDTTDWTFYVSDRYGFSIGHPADWTAVPADHDWTMTETVYPNPADESLMAPDGHVRASAWSVPVDPGTTFESWLNTYCPPHTTPCTGLEDRTFPVTMDGHPGSLVQFSDDTQAFILVGDRMYVVAVWRPDIDQSTAAYGSTTRLLKGYLETIHLLPGGPASGASAAPNPSRSVVDTSAWTLVTSDRYGFSIGYPGSEGWTHQPAVRDWEPGSDVAQPSSPAMERFMAPDDRIEMSAWAVPLEPGTAIEDRADLEAWVGTYCAATRKSPCTGIHERSVPLCLERRDCHPGLLVPFDDGIQAFFYGGIYDPSKMNVVAVWGDGTDPAVARYGGSQPLLEAALSTMGVWPESVPLAQRVNPLEVTVPR